MQYIIITHMALIPNSERHQMPPGKCWQGVDKYIQPKRLRPEGRLTFSKGGLIIELSELFLHVAFWNNIFRPLSAFN